MLETLTSRFVFGGLGRDRRWHDHRDQQRRQRRVLVQNCTVGGASIVGQPIVSFSCSTATISPGTVHDNYGGGKVKSSAASSSGAVNTVTANDYGVTITVNGQTTTCTLAYG